MKNGQSKHSTETEARIAARKLGDQYVNIIESPHGGVPAFYVETDVGMIRNWERVVFEGNGRDA